MLGIWEYFWDILDWTGVSGVKNICRVTGLMGQSVSQLGTMGSTQNKTGESTLVHNETGTM